MTPQTAFPVGTGSGRAMAWRSCVAQVAAVVVLACTGGRVAAQPPPASAAVNIHLGGYRIVQWTTAQGLPQNSVNDIVILPNGELWLATFGGLARFDGHGFNVVDMATAEGLPANRIVAMAASGTDAFWFLTQQGHLGRVERGVAVPRVVPLEPPTEILGLLVDRTGRIFGRSVNGGFWQTDGGRPWARMPSPDGDSGVLQTFAETDEGVVWAVIGGRLVALSPGTPPVAVSLPEHGVRAFRRDGGGLWLALRSDIARFVDGRVETLDVQPKLGHQVTAIENAPDGALWVASRGDVSRVDPQADGSWRRTSLPLGLPPELGVRSLRLDRGGGLWIGTDGQGLFRVNRPTARRFVGGARLEGAAGLATDGRGGAFLVSACRGVFHVDDAGTTTPITLPDVTGSATVGEERCGIALAPAGRDAVWVRAGSALFVVRRTGEFDITRVPTDFPDSEGPIVSTPDGAVWVVSREGPVSLVTPRGVVRREVVLPSPLNSASLAPDGGLWVGGDGGVFKVGADRVERYGAEAQVPRGIVRDIVEEGDGTVWIGSYGGGIGRMRAGRVVRLTVEQGLPDNSVSRMLDDGLGRLWISTNRGLAVVPKAELHAVADGDARLFSPVVFGLERGVAEANFGNPAGFAEAGGRLWFGTIDGVARIDAAKFPFNRVPPAVRIEAVEADDRPLALAETVAVPALTTRVRLTFAAFELLYPELMRFRFRVDGEDADWIDAGLQRSVVWAPPHPGRFRFLVEARNEDGVWSAVPAVVVLDVAAAWWQTTAFTVASVVGLVLAAAAGFRWRVRRIERRHAARVRVLEEQQQAEARLSSLRAQLEHVSRVALAGELAASLAHEVRQPIGAIVNNAEAGKRLLAKSPERAADLEAIFRDIVADAMRASEVVQGLRGFLRSREGGAAPIDLSSVVREMVPLVRRELTDQRMDLALDLDPALPPVEGFRVALGQVVVNLVMNACEALAAEPGPRRIAVTTEVRGDRVELSVTDNGPGLAPSVADQAFEPFVTTKPDGLGIGLAICRSIAEVHGGHLRAETPAGGGARMVLALPIAPGVAHA